VFDGDRSIDVDVVIFTPLDLPFALRPGEDGAMKPVSQILQGLDRFHLLDA